LVPVFATRFVNDETFLQKRQRLCVDCVLVLCFQSARRRPPDAEEWADMGDTAAMVFGILRSGIVLR
jgi:hypothetical protein